MNEGEELLIGLLKVKVHCFVWFVDIIDVEMDSSFYKVNIRKLENVFRDLTDFVSIL